MSESTVFRLKIGAPLAILMHSWRFHRLLVVTITGGACVTFVAAVCAIRYRRGVGALTKSAGGELISPLRPRAAGDSVVKSAPSGWSRRRSFSNISVLSTGSHHASATKTDLLPQQLGMLGVEALETAVGYWQDALSVYHRPAQDSVDLSRPAAMVTAEEAEFSRHLQHVIDTARQLQNDCQQMFLFYELSAQRSSTCSLVAGAGTGDCDCSVATTAVSLGRTWSVISGSDSFHSATAGVADLSDFDDFSSLAGDACDSILSTQSDLPPLYESALRLHSEGGIPCRKLRTAAAGLTSDADYVARIHCLRMGYQRMLNLPERRVWLTDAGRHLLTDLMTCAGRPCEDIAAAYNDLTQYLTGGTATEHTVDVWQRVREELQPRNVRCFTFFDLVLDYVVLDAFDDLAAPPTFLLAVVNNRWLTSGFKESAINTAIWSVMRAKRKALQYTDGFKSRYYSLAEQLMPVLAWGLLGTDSQLTDLCNFLKDHVAAYVRDIFSDERVRYSSVEEISDDLFILTKSRCQSISEWMAATMNGK